MIRIMMTMFLSLIVIGCGVSRMSRVDLQVPADNITITIDRPYEEVYADIVALFGRMGWPVTVNEKDRGFIKTADMARNIRQIAQLAATWGGHRDQLGQYVEGTMNVAVTLKPLSDQRTHIRTVSTFRGILENGDTVPWYSIGTVEAEVFRTVSTGGLQAAHVNGKREPGQ